MLLPFQGEFIPILAPRAMPWAECCWPFGPLSIGGDQWGRPHLLAF
ncbi:MAG: hypothetical protein IJM81_09230 [Prevotella sp.]|nr:hypothetical protein [Prevotella sp.]